MECRMFSLAATSPIGFAVLLLRERLARVRASDDRTAADRGASAIEWVVITAMLVVIAGAVFAVIYAKIISAAEAIDPAAPPAP
jgi:hypothetical protein